MADPGEKQRGHVNLFLVLRAYLHQAKEKKMIMKNSNIFSYSKHLPEEVDILCHMLPQTCEHLSI